MGSIRTQSLISGLKTLFKDICTSYLALIKVMLPAVIIVKLLDSLGASQYLASALSPLMSAMNLPNEMGLVWAAGMMVNVYTAMAVFYEVAQGQVISVAQISVLGLLILLTHAMPIEGSVSKACGVSWRWVIGLRIGSALVFGILLAQFYEATGMLQETATIAWQPEPRQGGLIPWVVEQIKLFVVIFFIIGASISVLRLLRVLGLEKFLHYLLDPLLKLIGVSKKAANVMVVGITLGLSFGAGLLLAESRSGTLGKRDILLSVCFLNLCHALLEDTFLILLLGADLTAILWFRLVIALGLIAFISRFIPADKPTEP